MSDLEAARLARQCVAEKTTLPEGVEPQLDPLWREVFLLIETEWEEGLTAWLKNVRTRAPDRCREIAKALVEAETLPLTLDQEEGKSAYATLADAMAIIGETRWFWPSWIPLGTMSVLAAKAGVGKTRTAMDLAKRLWFGLPMPDGSVNPWPKESRTLWILVDRNWGQTGDVARSFGVPPDAIDLHSPKGAPLSVPELDDPLVMASLVQQIRIQKPALVIVDTVTYMTRRNTAKAEEAKAAFDAILQMAAETGVPILALAHLNKEGEVLNRRITERARSVLSLSCPDPDNQPDRRKLWVSKTAVKSPPALGATNTENGFEYDFDPPCEPDSEPKSKGKTPTKSTKDAEWLWERLQKGPAHVAKLIDEAKMDGILADKEGASTSPLYNARDRIPRLHPGWRVDQEEVPLSNFGFGGRLRKQWRLTTDEPQAIPFDEGSLWQEG